MTTIAQHQFSDLLSERAGPCISLYLTTERRFPDQKQNVIRFKNQLQEAEQSLASLDMPLSQSDREALFAPLHELLESDRFWHHTLDGLAIFRAPDFYKVYKLQRAVSTRTMVADSFHIKPLLRVLQSADRFEILAITREHVRLFHGNRDALDEMELSPTVPRSLTDALGSELTEPYSSTRAISASGSGGSSTAVHYGSGSKSDEIDKDTERFFRVVDRAIIDSHSPLSDLPLVLAALPEYHAAFRSVSHNPHLVEQAIGINPDAISADELRARAWEILGPTFDARLQRLLDDFNAAHPRALASDDLSAVALAALGGRVRTLLVDADRTVPGSVDRATGQVTPGTLDDPHTDDIVDDLAELALRMGGDVVVVPRDKMPSITGVAAIYRF
ncbi:hypothetical protein [Gemmatimonas phototrophica]|uniref:eRF1 domain-containing protein n=1 Tax=Gemmatimonas phototrophica TaxID=1379270 RepID=A0A143BGP8_9BACT|nr:hypothetical protein [Gemmatimonas phototrophica]AMW03763.1 hypothetical protein GEMMAAP_00700 [Gemmatimonas phototrophica]